MCSVQLFGLTIVLIMMYQIVFIVTVTHYDVMLLGLLAKKAVESGLSVQPYINIIKTSLSPGSGVVTYYLKESGLSGVIPYLEKLG